MNFESVSRSSIVFVVMAAMSLSVLPVLAEYPQPEPIPSGPNSENSNQVEHENSSNVIIGSEDGMLPSPELLPPPYEKDPARMVPASSTTDSEELPPLRAPGESPTLTPTPTASDIDNEVYIKTNIATTPNELLRGGSWSE